MGAFGGLILTNKGRALQAKAQAGVLLVFNRIAMGDGSITSQSIVDLNALISEKKSLAISKLKTLTAGKAVVGASFSNNDIVIGFYFREIGIFAQDPDIGEILYCYGNAGAGAEYVPAGGGPDIVEKFIDAVTIVGSAASVSATIDNSLVYTTVSDFNTHQTANTLDHPDLSVTTIKIAPKAIITSKIADHAVDILQLAPGAAMMEMFYCKSAVYNGGKIDVTISPGVAIFLQTVIDKAADTVYSINAPVINTNYYVYLSSTGTFSHNITGSEVDGAIMLWMVSTGAALATITLLDLRGVVSGSAQAVKDLLDVHQAAGDPHPQYATDADLTAHMVAADPHPQYATDADLTAHTAASDPHPQYALDTDLTAKANLVSPALVNPTVSNQALGNNSTLAANTAFVQAAIAALIASSPAALDTLNELAAALGNDANFATTMTNALALKLNSSNYTAADVLAKLLTVDGPGTTLDADTVDGLQAAAFLLLAGGQTLAGFMDFARNELRQPKIKDYSEVIFTNSAATGAVALDLSLANNFDLTLTGATTLSFTNPAPTGQAHSMTVAIRQGGTAFAVTYPASVKWPGDIIPDISAINKTSFITFVTFNGGTRWYGFLSANGLVT